MDVKGVNPFLFTEEEYSPHSAVSNPFLLGDEDYQNDIASNDNPFFSQNATSVTTATTNPFAFDPMELEPAEAEVPHIQNNIVDFLSESSDNNITASQDYFSNNQDILINISATTTVGAPQKPTDLPLMNTHQDLGGPQRPPPPRPPPSKETQDLLMSVMGAMDATSSHLLDKIPPTRTPSPVSMRDLRTPSPTADAVSGDLLDVSDVKTHETDTSDNEDFFSLNQEAQINPIPTHNQQNTFSNLANIPSVPPNIPTSLPPNIPTNVTPNIPINLPQQIPNNVPPSIPSRPCPPVRPPRPQPPQKPPPPAIIQNTQIHQDIVNKPFPLPINQFPPTNSAQGQAQDEMMDMFGSEDVPPQKIVASKADILNLYNTPPKPEKAITDLLADVIEPDNQIVDNNNTVITETANTNNDILDVSPSMHQELIKDSFISPEPSQNDLQIDTSDSQSKGSVSSVTFNPFATTEEPNQQISPMRQNEVFPQDTTDNIFQQDAFSDNVFQQNTTPLQNNAIITDVFQQNTLADNVFQRDTVPLEENIFKQDILDNRGNSMDIFGSANISTVPQDSFATINKSDAFDAFAEKFESVKDENKNTAFDAFPTNNAWGNAFPAVSENTSGFGTEESFDAFLALQEPPVVPQSTPSRISKTGSQESDEDKDFSVFIRPKTNEEFDAGILPILAPPPVPTQLAFSDSLRFNPFDQQSEVPPASIAEQEPTLPLGGEFTRTDSQETPPTPLYDEDVSQPLEPFPRINFSGEGWEMQLRQPNKKKITGQRFWKKIFVRIVHQPDCVLLQLFNQQADKDPFQELPLQPCYSVSDIGAQQYDQFGKIFTLKLQYIFYKERPGVRPGQVKKAERITNKLSQFAAYAIQGDYQGCKEFGSDLKKLGLPVEHAPQVSQLMKLGSLNYEDLKQFSFSIEEALFKLQAHRDRALHYKMEEVQITAVDELYVEQDSEGHIEKQIARVRLFFLGFLTGMPDIELGINDMRRQGKEVVGRHDIIPVVTEEWIRLEDVEFHSCVQPDDYNLTHIIKFKPPDACYIELLRFRVRPPKNRELPLQLKAQIYVTGTRIELRADVLVPGFASRKLGQIPCEDVIIRFPIPECWIYLFRVEKHFRYGSVKSAHRRTGKIKGIERILGTVETLQENLIEVTSGQAKYEHQHRAIVWRCPRLPKEGQGAYTTHNMVCRIALTSYDQMPEKLAEYCFVEFTMPATQVSHTTCRSVSMQNSDSDEPPEKYVRYLARHEYRVGIEHTEGESPNAYAAATYASKPAPAPVPEEKPAPVPEESSSDSD